MFDIVVSTGRLAAPAAMHPWIERQFGSVAAVASQRLVKVTNRWTYDTTLFNELRARRPVESGQPSALVDGRGDAFCQPEQATPADVFGRVRGQCTVTAANVAKYDAWHSLIIFDEHDPLGFTEASIADAIETAIRWGRAVFQQGPEFRYFLLMWNCLWRAGASIVHGHMQAAMTSGSHYGKIEQWRAAARRYPGPYFDDFYRAHEALGLAFEWRPPVPPQGPRARLVPAVGGPPREASPVRVIAHLTPTREKEVLLIGGSISAAAIYRVLTALKPASFNLAVYYPPFGRPAWRGFPVVVRIVDRGDLASRTSDVGSMELFAASVVSSDPFDVIRSLRGAYTGL